jgi:hypothetical protein
MRQSAMGFKPASVRAPFIRLSKAIFALEKPLNGVCPARSMHIKLKRQNVTSGKTSERHERGGEVIAEPVLGALHHVYHLAA